MEEHELGTMQDNRVACPFCREGTAMQLYQARLNIFICTSCKARFDLWLLDKGKN